MWYVDNIIKKISISVWKLKAFSYNTIIIVELF